MSVPSAYAARSRDTAGTVAVPDAGPDPEGFVAALAEAARAAWVAAVLPGTETTLTALAGREADFPDGVVLAVPPRESRPGRRQVAAGRAVPAGRPEGSRDPAVEQFRRRRDRLPGGRQAGDELGPGRRDRSARLGAQDRLRRGPARGTRGDAGCQRPRPAVPRRRTSAACGVFWDGRIVCVEHQVARRIWPPTSVCRLCGDGRRPTGSWRSGSPRCSRAIGWSGIFELQFIRRPEGDYVIDLNTRFYGSLALAVGSGLNLPAIWVDLLLGRSRDDRRLPRRRPLPRRAARRPRHPAPVPVGRAGRGPAGMPAAC